MDAAEDTHQGPFYTASVLALELYSLGSRSVNKLKATDRHLPTPELPPSPGESWHHLNQPRQTKGVFRTF